jgi:cysteine synthase
MSKHLNVFKGSRSIADFLDPGKHPMMPLVELSGDLNPFAGHRVRIFARRMTFAPLDNIKSVPAFNMIREMHRRGELEGVDNIIENSSGNTVLSLALAAHRYGGIKTSSYVPHEISLNKLLMLLFFGVQPIVNQLSRAGIVVGPGSGFALCGLLNYLGEREINNTLDELRENDRDINCVFICCDGPVPYLDEYFKYLDSSDFPKIPNRELLVNQP